MKHFYKANRIGGFLLVALLIITISVPAIASDNFKPVFNPQLKVKQAPGEIKVDGKLNDRGWNSAVWTNHFVETTPGDNTEPLVQTKVRLTYDAGNLYVAFLCFDDPTQIRATMCQRDQFHSDDAVSLNIDTYGDASRAYKFQVNSYGIQNDYLWSSVAGDDHGFDLIWKSAAIKTDSGYQVEIAIPFASIRFPNQDVQTWKINFRRNHPRETFHQYSWAAIDRNESCYPCQWGTVNGIASVTPGKGVEILPTFVADQSSELPTSYSHDDEFDDGAILGEMSLNGKYSVNSDITVEASYNPDFSQIESDASMIDVNTTFDLLYPERRPFFQEGSDIFRTLFNSFNTRSIYDPQYAVKLTGRMNRTSVGFMSSMDESTPYVIPLDDRSITINTNKSYVNVLRASRTFGRNSMLGFMVTDRRLEEDGYGMTMALDGDIRFSRTYSMDWQAVYSDTKEPDDTTLSFEGAPASANYIAYMDNLKFDHDKYNANLNGESYKGYAWIARFMRHGRHWSFNIGTNGVSPSYRTQVGYDPVNNHKTIQGGSSYTFYPEKGIFERIRPSTFGMKRWSFDGVKRIEEYHAGMYCRLRVAQTDFDFDFRKADEMYGSDMFEDLWNVHAGFGFRPDGRIGVYISGDHGENIAYYDEGKGMQSSYYVGLNLKPVDRITIEPNIRYATSLHPDTDREFFRQIITRTRFQYQANRRLSLRMVVQYNYARIPSIDYSSKRWDFDPLLTYRISSFSVIYLGSTYDYNYLPEVTKAWSDDKQAEENVITDNMTWRMKSRRFFIKVQYLFQT